MHQPFEQLILTIYYLTLGILAIYGAHRLVLLGLYYRTRGAHPPAPPPPSLWPRVTVQLPLYNEMYVAERLIRAVAALDYPADRLEIQVLDDSTDETREIVAAEVARQRARGVEVHHLRRGDRVGFKAGALAAGLRQARGELLAVFDADFVPRPDFLRRTVPWFADPAVGMVQACWEHLNRGFSLLTRIQAMFLDAHFLIEHAARNRAGRFFNFNGTAGIWRRRTIVEAGGWQHDTLTEDLDLSYRAQLAGWRFLFLPDVKVPAELPVEINAFKRQQFRWAKGSVQTARKLLGRVFRSPVPLGVKAEAFFHLTSNGCYLLMVALSLLVFPAMEMRRGADPTLILAVDLPLFAFATLSFVAFYLGSQAARGGSWWRQLRRLPALMGLGIGLAINNARAVLEGLRRDVGVFERTPKYSVEGAIANWRGKRYRVDGDLSVLAEGLLALYFVAAFAVAVISDMWLSLPFLYLFVQGFCYIVLLHLVSSLTVGRRAIAGRERGAHADVS
ncbi:MAG: glycosyltransferase [Thermoanaerobaculia bacterium]|nr:glycosyltransferase [Thermoanaerobaculia bacterium]